MPGPSELIKKVVSNMLGLIVYGEMGDIDSKRGITTRHTRSQERRFAIVKKLITKTNVWLLNVSKGRLGNSFLGRPVLLLTTRGHKSGLPRTQPLFYVENGGRIMLVGSNGGSPEDPAWVQNIRTHPQATIRRNGVAQTMQVRIADAEEKARLWPTMTVAFPYWQEVSDRSTRDFPVIILEPEAMLPPESPHARTTPSA